MQALHTPLTLIVVDIIPTGSTSNFQAPLAHFGTSNRYKPEPTFETPLCLPQCSTPVKGASAISPNAVVVHVDVVVAAKSAFR